MIDNSIYTGIMPGNFSTDSFFAVETRQASAVRSTLSSSELEKPDCQLLYDRIRKTAKVNSNVLITGESGTGKTIIARMIHEQSSRRCAPFVVVNCAALTAEQLEKELFGEKTREASDDGDKTSNVFEAAQGGTLFLDRIGELPIEVQPRVLSTIQEGRIPGTSCCEPKNLDVRLIVATHRDLSEMCSRGKFREDLYYRLNVLQIRIPPLRDRKTELPKFVQNLFRKIALNQNKPIAKISADAIEKLQNHDWPGNIRELENVLERAAAFCNGGMIHPEDIIIDEVCTTENPQNNSSSSESVFYGKTLAEIEKLAILATLEYCNGNKAMTARTLGISEKSIYNKMKRLGIDY